MARNRQRAKQRQADRRAARLAERRAPQGRAARPAAAPEPEPAEDGFRGEPRDEPRIAAAAPPEDLGRSDAVAEAPLDEELEDDQLEEEELEDEALEEEALAEAPARDRGAERDRDEVAERAKVLTFLSAVWAELHRVQWPDRATLVTLTGVVLGFVLIAGAYLGALDAIFSRVIEAIL
jgi:preprotein translocase subunit SecE